MTSLKEGVRDSLTPDVAVACSRLKEVEPSRDSRAFPLVQLGMVALGVESSQDLAPPPL